MGTRDDFNPEVKDILAKRVGTRCSNPNCRQTTSGPREDPRKVLNIGVAAHITAASTKGPRYDHALSAEGHRVRTYCPVGDLVAGMAYLVRRLLENTANESFISEQARGAPLAELLAAP